MKRALFKNHLVATAIVLLTASTFADAACLPNSCAVLCDSCIESGVLIKQCETH